MNPSPPEPNDPSPWPHLYGLGEAFGEMKSDMAQIKADLKEIKSRLDDLIRWKTMILSGFSVIVALTGALAYVSAEYAITIVERPVVVLPAPR